MLEDASLKLVGFNFDLVTVKVNATKKHLLGPHNGPVQPGHRQAALNELPFTGTFDDFGIEQHPGVLVTVKHEDAATHPDLRRRQTHPGCGVHDVEHVLHELHQGAVDLGHITGPLSEHRIANGADVVGNHRHKGSVGPMAASTPGSHYFSEQSGPTAPRSVPRPVSFTVDGQVLEVGSDAGVFSADGIDEGSALLIRRGARPDPDHRRLLDLGCGWGPVALALALRAPEAEVVAVDVNQRAVALTAANAQRLGLANVTARMVPSDPPLDGLLATDDERFDAVWSNPPVRIGKRAMHALLLAAAAITKPDGALHLVVHRHLGSDSLHRWLDDQGLPTTRRLSRAGFRLLDATVPDGWSANGRLAP
jgi:16S rRNA (guanine1207-N2)-methyltransferase